ncbi:unnamed protein product [marine sediment metagenome]|uniref:Uncharacterized protein n=1 Tax=marine sediment metagenome TaxID=412755 RepID=X1NZX7_9ZZZZ
MSACESRLALVALLKQGRGRQVCHPDFGTGGKAGGPGCLRLVCAALRAFAGVRPCTQKRVRPRLAGA